MKQKLNKATSRNLFEWLSSILNYNIPNKRDHKPLFRKSITKKRYVQGHQIPQNNYTF